MAGRLQALIDDDIDFFEEEADEETAVPSDPGAVPAVDPAVDDLEEWLLEQSTVVADDRDSTPAMSTATHGRSGVFDIPGGRPQDGKQTDPQWVRDCLSREEDRLERIDRGQPEQARPAPACPPREHFDDEGATPSSVCVLIIRCRYAAAWQYVLLGCKGWADEEDAPPPDRCSGWEGLS